MTKKHKAPIMWALAWTRPIPGDTLNSFMYTAYDRPFIFRHIPHLAIDIARNRLCQDFLDHEAKPSHIVFVDSDATWHKDTLIRLLEWDVDVVVPGMYRRSIPPLPTMGNYLGKTHDGKHLFSSKKIIQMLWDDHHEIPPKDNELAMPRDDGNLVEIEGTGMHFAVIKREVIEALGSHWFKMGGKSGAGEDYYFCMRAQEAGFSIHWDKSLHTGHLAGEGISFGIVELIAFLTYVDRDMIADKEEAWITELDLE